MKILRAAIKTWHAPQNKQIICFLKKEIKLLCEQCPAEWLRSKSLQAINAGEGVQKREPSYTVGGNGN